MKVAMLCGTALLAAAPLVAQFSERIDVVAVEVPISVRDRAGKVPADLTKDDFEVFEDGARQEVIGLTYPVAYLAQSAAPGSAQTQAQPPQPAAQRWQIVIYIQESLSQTSPLRKAMKSLVDQAERLAAMGDVEIAGDYPTPHQILAPTHDAAQLGKVLGDLQRKLFGHEEVIKIRQRTGDARPNPVKAINSLPFGANEEAVAVRRRQNGVLTWMAQYSTRMAGGPRLLMFVSDGYSLDPVSFYWKPGATPGEYFHMTLATHQEELARTIAAQGWTSYSIAPGALFQVNDGSIMDKSFASVGFGPTDPPRLADMLDPMHVLDAETGGKLTTDMTRLGTDIGSFTERLTLTYQVRRRRDGKLHRLEIRSLRPGLSVESQHSVMSGSPEAVASARATALAMNFGQRGELPITCTIRPSKASGEEMFDVAVDFAPLAAARAGIKSSMLRVALSVAADKAIPFEELQNFENVDLSAHPTWDVSIPVRKRGRAPAAVVVEEVGTGVWGGVRCEARR